MCKGVMKLLSNVNLENALGKNIGIYPLNISHIEGASIDLLASRYAFSVKKKESVVKGERIEIDPGDTVIVFTNESISLDKHYSGACYNRVSFSMQGILHSSSPLKPDYTGRLSVSLYNASPRQVDLEVGKPVVVLMINKLNRPATIHRGKGNGSRIDLLQQMGITITEEEIRTDITKYDDRNSLMEVMKESDEYKRIKDRNNKKRIREGVIFVAVLLAIIMVMARSWISHDLSAYSFFIPIVQAVFAGIVSGLVLLWVESIIKQKGSK